MEVQAPPICHPSSQAAPELPSQGGRAVDSDKGTGRLGHPGPSLGHRPLFCRIGRLFFASTIETPDPTTITHSIATSSSPLPSLASIHARSLAGGLLLQQLSRREAPPPAPHLPPCGIPWCLDGVPVVPVVGCLDKAMLLYARRYMAPGENRPLVVRWLLHFWYAAPFPPN